MASNTPNLSLYMKDPVAEGNDFFDVKTMMNDNWEKIDGFAGVMDGVKERFDTITRQEVTLNAGVQIITAIKSALFSLDGVTGRMLVNLLGRMGNCESVGLWSSNTTIATDTANKTSGTSSFKLTLGSVPATASATFLTTPGKKYVAIADVKNGNTSKVSISINGIAGATGNDVAAASAFAPSVVRFAATDYFHILTITGTGASGNTFNMDSVRVYEVSDADYAAAATLTSVQVAAKWPYVDSVMPVRNPYAIRYGENLIPPFYEWAVNTTGVVTLQGPYKATATRTVPDVISPLRVVVPVLPNTDYTISSIGDGLQYIERRDNNDSDPTGEVATGVIAVGSKTFTTSSQTRFLSVRLRYAAAGSFAHENPMLNIGSTAKPFKPREDSMLALQTDLYADPVAGVNADTVFERDGQYFKSKKWQSVTLDGALTWTYASTYTGYKRVTIVLQDVYNPSTWNPVGVKFDGSLLKRVGEDAADSLSGSPADGKSIFVTVSIADSGWGDSYTPTADEIKAYFMGWRMRDQTTLGPYTSGVKAWGTLLSGGANNYTNTLPTTAAPDYKTPYQLVYQLATPTVEPIVSEGQLSFIEGDNQVEVGTGIVLREGVKAARYEDNMWINGAIGGSTPLNKRPKSFLAFYKDGKRDNWRVMDHGTAPNIETYGLVQANTPLSKFSDASSYSVTYMEMVSSPNMPFTGSYAANEKTLLSDLVDSVQQNTSRVSVLENKKADKDVPAWITPTTLLNGWVSMGVLGYRKIDNKVQVKARIKSGVIGQPFMVLPEGYRPLVGQVRPVHSYTTTDVFAAVLINADGKFIVSGGSNNEVNIYLEFTTD
ncbi:hypothetical protein MKY98_19205 [Paenibacillus sp. FSL M8-0228]|uniref:hypothetical protein n=1 Tax=Paenibacillus sp. FSL M8-0228 TaxID=2921620 RepID=UPI0030FAABC1